MQSTVISVDLPFGDQFQEISNPPHIETPKVDPEKCVRCKTSEGTEKISASERLLCKPCHNWANNH